MISKTGELNLKLSNYSSSIKLVDMTTKEKLEINDNNIKTVIAEMQKMKDMHILQDAVTDYAESEIEYSVYGREYNKLKKEYIINNVRLTTDGVKALRIEIEEKTGKVVYYISNSKYKIVDDIDTEEILRNYIKYLDLYIIDDWKFENRNTSTNIKFDYLMSEKARLLSAIIETDEEYIISLQTIERFEDLFSEVKRNNSDTN